MSSRSIVITDWSGFDYLLKGGAITRAIRVGANRAAAKVKPLVIAAAPSDLGYLKKSIRIKVTLKKAPDNRVIVRIGPGSSLVYKKGKYKRGSKWHPKGEAILHKPARYAHLAEKKYHYNARVQRTAVSWFYDLANAEIAAEIRKAESKVK